ncbi:coiled-coil domain-containing protein 186 isoform X2 [Chelonus insularis]|uniref:coiled-coil domain-containing protein 186 isoform X2 n=1 Tax=Chelonus insularis TaxID=460826 RepID=UPI00158E3073|nr:coiled-coil domain-containing protein 186 isoform X2 [Chelonus insularis]
MNIEMDSNTCHMIDNIVSTSCPDMSKGLLPTNDNVNCNIKSSNIDDFTEKMDVAALKTCQAIESNVSPLVEENFNQNTMQLVIKPSITLESSSMDTSTDYKTMANLPAVNNSIESSVSNGQEQNKIFEQPTLNDQNKFVKFSLPSNSINLIQSSTPFINKSKHLFNLITEKSTNIMERTLLPQYLVVRNDLNDKKRLEYTVTANSMKSSEEKVQESNPMRSSVNMNEKNQIAQHEQHHNMENGSINESNDINKKLLNTEITNSIENDKDNLNSKDKVFSQIIHEDKIKPIDEVDLTKQTTDEILNMDYTELLKEYKRMRDEKLMLEVKVKRLESCTSKVNNGEEEVSNIDDREKTIERLTNELRTALTHQDEMQKELAMANREKESMVMKYVGSEKQLLDNQKAKNLAEKKIKDLARDYEMLECKWKHAHNERIRISNILDARSKELLELQKEVDKLKEDIDVREVKLKWTQTKLKSEMEMHKETHEKLDKALIQINQMKEEFERIRKESHDTIKKFQQSEENKAVTLDHQLKEQHAQLILERHVTEDKEMLRLQLVKEVETLKNRQHILMEENNTLSLKIEELEKNKLDYENNISNLKAISDQRQKEIIELTEKLCNLNKLKLELINKEECLVATQAELNKLKSANKELQVDMECCLQRESNMLEFTQKLTDKNVQLQSEFSAIEAKANQLQVEQGPLHETIVQLKAKVKTLQDNLTAEKNKRIEECEILARHVAEQTQLAQNLTQMLEDSRGENTVLKRKHQMSIKELTRELQQLRKKLEAFEAKSSNALSTQGDGISRAASSTSLNAENVSQNGTPSFDTIGNNEILSYNNLDKNALIDRIIKLQRTNVKRAEKLDFLEEHTRALVAELQKKTKIIQNYILTENFDAMGSNERDKYKAELIKHGGIMASVYHQRVSDDNMTLELSLEINQKLQTVLEDALLKNITLKDNIDTLGEEIARLTIQNQQKTTK